MEIKIDGQVIKLSTAQAQQFKKAVMKEVPDPIHPTHKLCGNGITLYCKPIKGSYPLVMTQSAQSFRTLKSFGLTVPEQAYPIIGRDYNKAEFQNYVRLIKTFAKKIWPDFKV